MILCDIIKLYYVSKAGEWCWWSHAEFRGVEWSVLSIVEWCGVECMGVECRGVEWSGLSILEWCGVECMGVECRGVEWSGLRIMEWCGVEWVWSGVGVEDMGWWIGVWRIWGVEWSRVEWCGVE